MNFRNHLKFVSLISTVSLVMIVAVVFLTQNVFLGLLIGLIADSVQIVTYILWFFQKEVPMQEVPKQVEQIHRYVTLKEEKNKIKEELISRLVNEGVIRETELYSLIRNKEIVLAFPYGKGIPAGIKNLGYRRPSHMILLEKIGFVRATRNQNLMVAFTDNLPKSLRNVDSLNIFLKTELPKTWKQISEETMKKFPSSQYPQKFEKWRTGEGFGVMYILSKSTAQDFVIDYVNRESFTLEFKKHVWRVIDHSRLRNAIKKRKHQVKKIVSKISIDFLLRDVPTDARQSIITHEDAIKKHFGIKVFTDYRFADKEKMTDFLSSLLPKVDRSMLSQYSSIIIVESLECNNVLKQLGISF